MREGQWPCLGMSLPDSPGQHADGDQHCEDGAETQQAIRHETTWAYLVQGRHSMEGLTTSSNV